MNSRSLTLWLAGLSPLALSPLVAQDKPADTKPADLTETLSIVKDMVKAGQIVEAEKLLVEAAKQDPTSPKVAEARTLVRTAKAKDAAGKRETYLTAMNKARNFYLAKKYDEAIESANDALQVFPDDRTANALKSSASKRKELLSSKKEEPKEITPEAKLSPADEAMKMIQEGSKAELGRNYPAAAQYYAGAMRIAPLNADLKRKADFCRAMAQGQIDLTARRFPQAVSDFEQALQLDPNSAEAKAALQAAKSFNK